MSDCRPSIADIRIGVKYGCGRKSDCAKGGRDVALAFDRDLGILIIQTPNPLTSQTLAGTFRTVIRRTLREANAAIDGLPVLDVQFQSKR